MRRGVLLFVAPLFLEACSLLVDTDGFDAAKATVDAGADAPSAPAEGGVPPSPTGVPQPSSHGDASTDEPSEGGPSGNLLVNAGFEDGPGDCGDRWKGEGGAFLNSTSTSHGGTNACHVCAPDNTWIDADSDQVASVVEGETYHLEAWIRLDKPSDAPVLVLGVEYNRPGADQVGVPFTPTTTYVRYSADLTVGAGNAGQRLSFFISKQSGTNCFVVDDVVLTKK